MKVQLSFVTRLRAFVLRSVRNLQKFIDRVWYSPLVGLLAFLDNFIVIVPTDGILISSSMLRPRKWFGLAFAISLGSTLGALILAALVESHGLPWILEFYPNLNNSQTWVITEEFFHRFGLLLVFGVAMTPLMQQPSVILAGLANTPLMELAVVVFVGRFIKFLIMAYAGSHAPRLLSRMWGVQGELKDVGVSVPKQP